MRPDPLVPWKPAHFICAPITRSRVCATFPSHSKALSAQERAAALATTLVIARLLNTMRTQP